VNTMVAVHPIGIIESDATSCMQGARVMQREAL